MLSAHAVGQDISHRSKTMQSASALKRHDQHGRKRLVVQSADCASMRATRQADEERWRMATQGTQLRDSSATDYLMAGAEGRSFCAAWLEVE